MQQSIDVPVLAGNMPAEESGRYSNIGIEGQHSCLLNKGLTNAPANLNLDLLRQEKESWNCSVMMKYKCVPEILKGLLERKLETGIWWGKTSGLKLHGINSTLYPMIRTLQSVSQQFAYFRV